MGQGTFLGFAHGPRNMFDLRLARAKGERQQGQEAGGQEATKVKRERPQGKGSRPKAQAQKRLLIRYIGVVLATAWPRNTQAGLTPQCCFQVGLA